MLTFDYRNVRRHTPSRLLSLTHRPASSRSRTCILMRLPTFSVPVLVKSRFELYAESKSNTLCSVLAKTSVPSTSILAAAIPVGAAALQERPCTIHPRQTVVSKHHLPVTAAAWTMSRRYFFSTLHSTTC